MRRPRRWLAVSAAALVLAGLGIAVRGIDLGVEFTGGRLIEYATTSPLDPDRVRTALAGAGFPRAVVQSSGDTGLTVRTDPLTNAEETEVTGTVRELAGRADKVRDELIGPAWARDCAGAP
ncbi:Protein-export membrane protein SecF OS=Streptomyces violarus OX=67380 GN=secF PE=3 SV=1 [Streptomyces violarus]